MERIECCFLSVVKEFCRISLDFIRKGVNRKVYQSAARECILLHHGCYGYCAEKLDVDVATIQHGVEGLMYLLTECSKLMVFYICCKCICIAGVILA